MSKKIITLDSSQLVDFCKCPQMWEYRYDELLSLPGAESNEAMNKGSFMHLALDLFYKYRSLLRNESRYAVAHGVMGAIKKCGIEYELTLETREFLFQRFLQYVMRYDSGDFTPLVKNGVVASEVGFSKVFYEDERVIYALEGKIDLLTEMNGKTVIVDHKYQGTARDLYIYKPQILTYFWAVPEAEYAIYNYIRGTKEVNDKTFVKQLIPRNEHKIKEWRAQVMQVFHDIAQGFITRNLAQCAGNYDSTPCQFTKLCETENSELRETIKKNFYKKGEAKWKPW